MGESDLPALLQNEQRFSAKSDVPKALFPGIGKITNLIPGSSDFEDLAVVFSSNVLCENKKHIWAVKDEAISWKKFIQVIQIEKPSVANLINYSQILFGKLLR